MTAIFSLNNIPFESLPTETVRSLCEIAVRHMGSNVRHYEYGLVRQVTNMDYRIPATMRIAQGYGYGSSNVWGPLSENKEAVMALLRAVISERDSGAQNHIMLGNNDIAPSVITDPEVLSFVLNDVGHFGGGRNGSGCIESQIFNQVKNDRWNALFEEHPALVAKAFASRTFLVNRFVRTRGLQKDRVLHIAKTAFGFSHMFDTDSPTVLSREGFSMNGMNDGIRPDIEEIYDDLFMHLCVVCRKDSQNMQRIKSDLDNSVIGGKKTRRREAGWLTLYLNNKWENGHKDFVIRVCRLVPPFFNLLHSSTKVSGEMRTLRRMYQLSGDAN
jgi:hypothetical protein